MAPRAAPPVVVNVTVNPVIAPNIVVNGGGVTPRMPCNTCGGPRLAAPAMPPPPAFQPSPPRMPGPCGGGCGGPNRGQAQKLAGGRCRMGGDHAGEIGYDWGGQCHHVPPPGGGGGYQPQPANYGYQEGSSDDSPEY